MPCWLPSMTVYGGSAGPQTYALFNFNGESATNTVGVTYSWTGTSFTAEFTCDGNTFTGGVGTQSNAFTLGITMLN
jgi:hypothetical protein